MPDRAGKTVGDLQGEPMSAWGNADIISGLRFIATIQLRTPLRVLSRHGETHTDKAKSPPKIALEEWEGIWMPETNLLRDLGIDRAKFFTMASDIGPIATDGGDYLKFLIEVRKVVETDEGIEDRRKKLARALTNPAWREFIQSLKGNDAILNRLFPPFLSAIPRLPDKAAAQFTKLGYVKPSSFAAASDGELLAISGIGPGLLRTIRIAVSNAPNLEGEFLDNVLR